MTTPNPYGAPAPGAYPPPPQHGAPAYPGAPAPHGAGAFPVPGAHPDAAPAPMPGTPASLGRRVGAYAIDVAVIAAAVGVWLLCGTLLANALGGMIVVVFAIVAWMLTVAWWFVYTAMQGGHGSIGMRLMKLRLVRLETGAALGFGGAFLRNVIWALGSAIVVGVFSVFFDKTGRRQGWHDKVAHAFMRDASTDARPGAPGAPGHVAAPRPAPVSPVAPAYGGAVPPAPAAVPPAAVPPTAPPPPAPAAAPAPAFPASAADDTYAGYVPPRPPLPAQPAPPVHHSAPAAPAAPSGDGLIAFVPGITQDPPPQSRPAEVSPALPEEELDSDTILVRPSGPEPDPAGEADLEDTRLVRRTRPAVLEWDDSTRHTVASRSVFGRNPSAPDGAETVVVRDETLSLSKTHFEIVVTAEDVTVVDHHSTNGVTIVRAGERITATPGEPVALEEEDALEIGDRIVTFKGRG